MLVAARGDERRRKRASTPGEDDGDAAGALISLLRSSFSPRSLLLARSAARARFLLLFARSVICTARRAAIGPR